MPAEGIDNGAQGTQDGAQGTQTQTPPSSTSQGSQTQPSTQAPAPGSNAGGSTDDARNRGILADLQRERRARQEAETRATQREAELASERRRVQALAGVTPQSPEAQEEEEVRARVIKLFPVLGKLNDEQLDAMLAGQNDVASARQLVHQQWENHGRQMIDSIVSEVSDAVGGDLTERQAKALTRAYVAEAESNPEFLARHERGDKNLIKEFAKAWVEDWFEPARRRVTADAMSQNRRVPSGRDRTVQTTPPKAIDFKNPKAVEDAMVESFRSHGGRFEN